jgi:hypothetical protein
VNGLINGFQHASDGKVVLELDSHRLVGQRFKDREYQLGDACYYQLSWLSLQDANDLTMSFAEGRLIHVTVGLGGVCLYLSVQSKD